MSINTLGVQEDIFFGFFGVLCAGFEKLPVEFFLEVGTLYKGT